MSVQLANPVNTAAKKNTFFICFCLVFIFCFAFAINVKKPSLKMGLLKYNGGGDWYSNPTALPNLAEYCNKELKTNFEKDYGTVEVGSAELFNYSFLHMTGFTREAFNMLLEDLFDMRRHNRRQVYHRKRRGRPPLLALEDQLGLILFYFGSTMTMRFLCMIFCNTSLGSFE